MPASPDHAEAAEIAALAEELATLLHPMRATSRFAVETFLRAVREGHQGAELTIHAPARKGTRAEASFSISPDRSVKLPP